MRRQLERKTMDKVGEQQACLCGKAQTQNVGGGEANRRAQAVEEGQPGLGHSLQAGV